MKHIIVVLIFLFISNIGVAQNVIKTSSRKGQLYFYWGWNRSWYGKSNIQFKGSDYDFTINNVRAKDRHTPFSVDKYLNPSNLTIPQFNFRIGYYIKKNYSVSIGIDHMKYVMIQNQQVLIEGYINNSTRKYNGVYNNESILLVEDFLQFEHTDGLNYLNIDGRRDFNLMNKYSWISLNGVAGVGLGVLIPKTNTTLLNNERYDDFHLSGYGINGLVGLKSIFFYWFFIQVEFKGGYINMPNIRTTQFIKDSASQSFLFAQANFVFGVQFNLTN